FADQQHRGRVERQHACVLVQKDPQPALRIALSRRRFENRLETALHGGLVHQKEQVLLAGEVVIDARLGQPEPLGQERHRRVVVAALEKKLERDFDHFLDATNLLRLRHKRKSLSVWRRPGAARKPLYLPAGRSVYSSLQLGLSSCTHKAPPP